MYFVIGLGNPGDKYLKTRHNVGFMAVEKMSEENSGQFRKGKGRFLASKITIGGHPTLLVKPTTYMNLSGEAVRQVVEFYKVEDLTRILIVVDDFNIPFGTLRLRPSGSAGGQNGLKSIFRLLHTNDIARLRIGIGNQFSNAKNHVLSPFNREETKELPFIIDRSAEAIESFVKNGISATMNDFNRDFSSS